MDLGDEYHIFYECCRSKVWDLLNSVEICKISVMEYFVPENSSSIGDCTNEAAAAATR
jgi:hypothetical protein